MGKKSKKSGNESPPVSPGRRESRKTVDQGLKNQKAVGQEVQKAPGNVSALEASIGGDAPPP